MRLHMSLRGSRSTPKARRPSSRRDTASGRCERSECSSSAVEGPDDCEACPWQAISSSIGSPLITGRYAASQQPLATTWNYICRCEERSCLLRRSNLLSTWATPINRTLRGFAACTRSDMEFQRPRAILSNHLRRFKKLCASFKKCSTRFK